MYTNHLLVQRNMDKFDSFQVVLVITQSLYRKNLQFSIRLLMRLEQLFLVSQSGIRDMTRHSKLNGYSSGEIKILGQYQIKYQAYSQFTMVSFYQINKIQGTRILSCIQVCTFKVRWCKIPNSTVLISFMEFSACFGAGVLELRRRQAGTYEKIIRLVINHAQVINSMTC